MKSSDSPCFIGGQAKEKGSKQPTAEMSKQIAKVWTFASDSNPSVEYETLQYTDGTSSCNCKGWTRRVAPDGSRSCKHYVFKHIMFVM
jgi:hypothetical protein